jgi:hypothetical protein
MGLTLENIEQRNSISQQDFGQFANWLYGSVAISPKDDASVYHKKEQNLDFLIAFLKDYYDKNEWESDDAEGDFLDFLSKVQLQKELLQIVSGKIKLKDLELAIHSFALKCKYPIGMR